MKTLLNKLFAVVAVAAMVFACEGPEGPAGPAGQDGQDGASGSQGSAGASALVNVTAEAAGDNCANGGFKIEVGVDTNGNGSLDASEITGTAYACTGAAGASFLVNTTEEPAGENCAIGGIKVEAGIDTNGNEVLDAEEITETTYVCLPYEVLTPLESSIVDANLVFDLNTAEFPNAQVEMIMTSKDILPSDSAFVYGSFTDGMALYEGDNGNFELVVNQEADYGQSRITLNADLKPMKGEVIADAFSTAFTAQCSGSGIYPEVHGFGPYYLSGGEWGGNAKGVYIIDPNKPADLKGFAQRSTNMGEWSTENAVALSKDAYSETVVIIGDDDSNNTYPEGHLGMYVGRRGDLFTGDLYVLRGKDTTETAVGGGGLKFEMGMVEGNEYDVEWLAMTQRTITELNQEGIDSAVIGFQRIEDIDWQRGSADDNRKVFFVTTGRYRSGEGGPELTANTTAMRGTTFGRIYMLDMNDNDPTGDAKLSVILDGDDPNSVAWGFNSPDNILVTEGYVYIQEDPNGYWDDGITVNGTASVATQWPKIYQYNIATGDLKTLITADQTAEGVQDVYTDDSPWEFTGMIEVSRITGSSEPVFLCGVQVHDWGEDSGIVDMRADGKRFHDPRMIPAGQAGNEGSFLFKITGIE